MRQYDLAPWRAVNGYPTTAIIYSRQSASVRGTRYTLSVRQFRMLHTNSQRAQTINSPLAQTVPSSSHGSRLQVLPAHRGTCLHTRCYPLMSSVSLGSTLSESCPHGHGRTGIGVLSRSRTTQTCHALTDTAYAGSPLLPNRHVSACWCMHA